VAKLALPLVSTTIPLVYFAQSAQKHIETEVLRIFIGISVLVAVVVKMFQMLKARDGNHNNDQEKVNLNKKSSQNSKGKLPFKSIIPALITGCLAGSVGGLIGGSGIPLMLFFLFSSHAVGHARISAVCVTTASTIIRLFTYFLTQPPNNDFWPETETWFIQNDVLLYASVFALALLGAILGNFFHSRISNETFNICLLCLLTISSVVMISKSIVLKYFDD